MGFDRSYYVLPASKLANFRQACIRCYGQKSIDKQLSEASKNNASKQQMSALISSFFSKNMEQKDGFSEDDVYEYIENHKLFYWLAPRPWKQSMAFIQNFGGLCSSYYITTKEHVIAQIKKTEPEWVEEGMEQEFTENELAYGTNLYKKMVQIMNACPENCFVIMSTSS